MQVDAGKTERGRDERCCRLPVGAKALAVEKQFGVEFARSPEGEHLTYRGLVDPEHRDHRREIRRKVDDRADVEIAVGPGIKTIADALRKRVVHV